MHAGRQLRRRRLVRLCVLILRLRCLLVPNGFCLVSAFRSHALHRCRSQRLVRIVTVLNDYCALIGLRMQFLYLDVIKGCTFVAKITPLPNVESNRFLGLNAWQFHRLNFSLVVQLVGFLE